MNARDRLSSYNGFYSCGVKTLALPARLGIAKLIMGISSECNDLPDTGEFAYHTGLLFASDNSLAIIYDLSCNTSLPYFASLYTTYLSHEADVQSTAIRSIAYEIVYVMRVMSRPACVLHASPPDPNHTGVQRVLDVSVPKVHARSRIANWDDDVQGTCYSDDSCRHLRERSLRIYFRLR